MVISLLVVLFATPGYFAYFFYKNPQLLNGSRTNKGELFTNLKKVPELNAQGKWVLFYWDEQGCFGRCVDAAEKLARIRLALGRKLYDVDLKVLLGSNSRNISQKNARALQEQGVAVSKVAHESLAPGVSQQKGIFIADGRNNLVIYFDLKADSKDIYSDLKKLLSTNPILNEKLV